MFRYSQLFIQLCNYQGFDGIFGNLIQSFFNIFLERRKKLTTISRPHLHTQNPQFLKRKIFYINRHDGKIANFHMRVLSIHIDILLYFLTNMAFLYIKDIILRCPALLILENHKHLSLHFWWPSDAETEITSNKLAYFIINRFGIVFHRFLFLV